MSSEVLKTELVKVGQDSLQAVRQSGHGWLLIKAACEVLGIDTQAQQRRLERTPWATGGMITAVGADGRTREMFCLRSDKVAMWLATIDTSRLANDEARAKLVIDRQPERRQPGPAGQCGPCSGSSAGRAAAL